MPGLRLAEPGLEQLEILCLYGRCRAAILPTWQFWLPVSYIPREKHTEAFSDLASEIMLHYFHHFLLERQLLYRLALAQGGKNIEPTSQWQSINVTL